MKRQTKEPEPESAGEPALMTLLQVADYLNCNSATISRLLAKRAIPAFRFGHGWRFRHSDLEKWIEKQHVEPAESGRPRTQSRRRPRRRSRGGGRGGGDMGSFRFYRRWLLGAVVLPGYSVKSDLVDEVPFWGCYIPHAGWLRLDSGTDRDTRPCGERLWEDVS